MKRFILLMGLGFLGACADADFEPYAKLGPLRVLAVKAERPELSLGESTELSALVSWVDRAGRTLRHELVACVDPGVSLGAAADCTEAPTRKILLAEIEVELASGDAASVLSLGSIAVGDFLDESTFGAFPASTRYNGVAVLLVYTVRTSDGSEVKAAKSVIVSESDKVPKNLNPTLNGLTLDGTPQSEFPSTSGTLLPDLASNEASESYTRKNSDGSILPQVETPSLTWFSTEGSFRQTRTVGLGDNAFSAEASDLPASSPSRGLVVVVRDGRGGVDFLVRR